MSRAADARLSRGTVALATLRLERLLSRRAAAGDLDQAAIDIAFAAHRSWLGVSEGQALAAALLEAGRGPTPPVGVGDG